MQIMMVIVRMWRLSARRLEGPRMFGRKSNRSPQLPMISQLKACVAKAEELEAERTKLMEDVTSNKRKMKELEDNLLFKLTSTQVR